LEKAIEDRGRNKREAGKTRKLLGEEKRVGCTPSGGGLDYIFPKLRKRGAKLKKGKLVPPRTLEHGVLRISRDIRSGEPVGKGRREKRGDKKVAETNGKKG